MFHAAREVLALLLSAAFFFDVFWVFISPLFFQKSVMIEVARGGKSGHVRVSSFLRHREGVLESLVP